MNTDIKTMSKIHQGLNVKRLRDMLDVKQETIAAELSMTQQTFSKLEQREQIEDELLEKIAKVLQVPVDAIKNMSDESTINYINTFNDQGHGFFTSDVNYTFNPIDKIVELYERLVNKEQEKVALLEQQLKEKK